MSATLKDIAQRANVSPTAVSHVLNNRLGKVGVSREKQARIRQVARELGYVPNRQAQSMATGRSRTIGVVGAIRHARTAYGAEYFLRVLRSVERVCLQQNYNCLMATSDVTNPAAFMPSEAMRDGSLDGVVLVGYSRREVLLKLQALNLLCVQVGTNVDPDVTLDNYFADLDAGFAEAVEALCSLGHRRISLVLSDGPGPHVLAENFSRLTDPRRGLTTHAAILAVGPSGQPDFKEHVQGVAESVRAGQGPTAFIVESGACAEVALHLYKHGLECPRDYSLVGIGTECLLGEHLVPNGAVVSAIVMPMEEVGERAASRLLSRCNDEVKRDQKPVHEALACRLVMQESCGPVPSASRRIARVPASSRRSKADGATARSSPIV